MLKGHKLQDFLVNTFLRYMNPRACGIYKCQKLWHFLSERKRWSDIYNFHGTHLSDKSPPKFLLNSKTCIPDSICHSFYLLWVSSFPSKCISQPLDFDNYCCCCLFVCSLFCFIQEDSKKCGFMVPIRQVVCNVPPLKLEMLPRNKMSIWWHDEMIWWQTMSLYAIADFKSQGKLNNKMGYQVPCNLLHQLENAHL